MGSSQYILAVGICVSGILSWTDSWQLLSVSGNRSLSALYTCSLSLKEPQRFAGLCGLGGRVGLVDCGVQRAGIGAACQEQALLLAGYVPEASGGGFQCFATPHAAPT